MEEVDALDVPSAVELRCQVAQWLETDAEFAALDSIKDHVLEQVAGDYLLAAARAGIPRDEAVIELTNDVTLRVRTIAASLSTSSQAVPGSCG